MVGLPLHGIRVIDFTWHGAGPYATKVLADHGADVVRIESGKRPDRLRNLPPFRDGIPGIDRSGYYADRNSNKRDVTINLKHPRAAALVLDLIARGDIVANNFTPGTMDSLGIGYDAARSVRPDVIYLEMAMQGASGPDSDRVGYGQTVSALTGLHHLSGSPGRVPVGTGTNYPDHIAAPCHAAIAVLAALRHRRRTGEGTYIDLAQTETMISLLGPAVLDLTVNGRVDGPQGNRSPTAAPHGVLPCQGDDTWIAVAVETTSAWAGLLAVLGLTVLADDPRFATMPERQTHHDKLMARLAVATRRWDRYALMAELQANGVPAGVVQTAQDLLENDPQLAARDHFPILDHPVMGPSRYNAPPFRLRGVDEPTMRRPSPLLGQHTAEVARDVLGLQDLEIEQLVADGVLV